ncbi:hypothetical protein NDR87_31795 [Nocardia sp. CDC159]|uniref:Uncharacterized protein n=1 Tax=Nocardia pulmonis TaxID=2951408 RepID=A0A9X2J0Q4_9NOCA|nr:MULTISPECIES: hypothetical protein [Nocardia]MCM6778074.1 hypothetical protein [Nocardia pulmonis]MCM6790963.1 hypothetical protein [Nocardia sp. CDC159]
MSATSINSCTPAYERARRLLGGADPEVRSNSGRRRSHRKVSKFDQLAARLRAAALGREISG